MIIGNERELYGGNKILTLRSAVSLVRVGTDRFGKLPEPCIKALLSHKHSLTAKKLLAQGSIPELYAEESFGVALLKIATHLFDVFTYLQGEFIGRVLRKTDNCPINIAEDELVAALSAYSQQLANSG